MGKRNMNEPINSHNSAKEYTSIDLQEMQKGEFRTLIFSMMKGLTVSIQELKEEIETLRINQRVLEGNEGVNK